MKNFVKSALFMMLVSVGIFISCSKDEINSKKQTNEEIQNVNLTAKQVVLKEKMNKAAQILAQFSNNKEVQKEVQSLIKLEMYDDDYITFKDLFQPEKNTRLKSKNISVFATAFRKILTKNTNKSINFDIETFLTENDLCLYIPYPLSDYPEEKQIPTVSFHPLDNDSVNIGYIFSETKQLNYQLINQVDEAYSEEYPVYIISPTNVLIDFYHDGSGSGNGNTGGGNTSTGQVLIKMKHMKITKQFDNIFNGGSEIGFVFADAVSIDSNNEIANINVHYSAIHNFSRKDIRKGNWKYLSVSIDPDWKENETVNYCGAVEVDKKGTLELGITATVKITDSISLGGSLKYTIPGANDFIGERELTRNFFFASQKNPALEGHGTYDGNVIRPIGSDLFFTTTTTDY